jgi:hypothetical protein
MRKYVILRIKTEDFKDIKNIYTKNIIIKL